MPGETQYQELPPGKAPLAIPYTQFGDWVLSNFKNINDLKLALNKVYVVNQVNPELGNAILPAHASIFDSSGHGIVVEFYDNKINVYEHMGVMTNAPKYFWHVANLRNYLNLSPNNPATISQDGLNFTATGQGTGATGLPGDASPPSRFVKTAFMVHNAYPAKDKDSIVNLAEHIINNVDIPAGYVRATEGDKVSTDTTQWVVFKDLSNKLLYYRTYGDLTLRVLDLKQVDFSENAKPLKMALQAPLVVKNITPAFIASQKDTLSEQAGNNSQ